MKQEEEKLGLPYGLSTGIQLAELGFSDTNVDISIFDTYRKQEKLSKYQT
jgi:hypothetical protein